MHDAILIIAASTRDANLYYATRFLAPDPFIFTEIRGKKYLLMSDLELDRAKSQAKVDQVLSTSRLAKTLFKKGVRPSPINLIDNLYQEKKVKTILVPENFSILYGEALKKKGYRLLTKEEPFFEERLFKTEEEINKIIETQRAVEAAVHEAIRMIADARVTNGKLYANGKPLTSEAVRKRIHVALMERDCVAEQTIVACGQDTVDPHNWGSGILYADEAIVMDVFPRSSRSGYFADMTRTVVRGKAKPKLKKMYRAVKEGQEIAFGMLKDGVDGKSVHTKILQHFEKEGFKTGTLNGRIQGFFHGTGHGVGLEIHEPPRVSSVSQKICARQVVTVEPGLYYLDAGGVRIEDMVVVTKTGNKNLTRFPKVLEI